MLNSRAIFLLFAAASSALAVDSRLLNLVMPDAKVIAGVEVAQGKLSPFGQYVLSHMQPDDAAFNQFIQETGLDPRRDLTEILLASNATVDVANHWVMVARGAFDGAKIRNAVVASGGSATPFQGVTILTQSTATPQSGTQSVVALLDAATAAVGDSDSIKGVIQRFQSSTTGISPLLAKVRAVSAANDFWFVTLVPVSEFSAIMPDQNMGQAMNGNLMQAVQQASGGLKFGAEVRFSLEAVTRSDKDASALADVFRFIGGLIQTNRDKNPGTKQISTLVDTMLLNTVGKVMTMSLSIPESTLEQMLDAKPATKRAQRL